MSFATWRIRLPARTAAPSSRRETAAAQSWRDVAKQAALLWLATRLALILFTYLAAVFSGRYTGDQPLLRLMLHSWQHWDADWYIKIATFGYLNDEATAFFPLYPALIHALGVVLGSSHLLLGALLISNLAALAAFVGVGLLAAHEYGQDEAPRAILVLAAYPLAFFLVSAYTEPLFLAFAVFSIYCARRGLWRWAALCAFFAALTRPTGAILLLPLVWEYGRQHDWLHAGWRSQLRALQNRSREGLRDATDLALIVAAVPLAFAIYGAYLYTKFHHPLLFLHAQSIFWQRSNVPFWRTLPLTFQQFFATPAWSYWQSRQLVDLAPVLIFGALTMLTIRRMPFAFTIYMAELVYLTIGSPATGEVPLVSSGRFLVVAFPMFVILAHWARTRPWLEYLLVGGGFLLQAVFAYFFLQGHWLV
jgi:Mannosyltransferase (PIG-V)